MSFALLQVCLRFASACDESTKKAAGAGVKVRIIIRESDDVFIGFLSVRLISQSAMKELW